MYQDLMTIYNHILTFMNNTQHPMPSNTILCHLPPYVNILHQSFEGFTEPSIENKSLSYQKIASLVVKMTPTLEKFIKILLNHSPLFSKKFMRPKAVFSDSTHFSTLQRRTDVNHASIGYYTSSGLIKGYNLNHLLLSKVTDVKLTFEWM